MAQVTFEVTQSEHDGDIVAAGATWPPSGRDLDTTTIFFEATKGVFFGPNFNVGMALMRWDTSSIPEAATVTAAAFGFVIVDRDDEESPPRNVVFEWYDFGTIGEEDYTLDVGTTAHAGVLISSLQADGVSGTLPLLNPENVNKSGFTGLRMGIEGGEPIAVTKIEVASYENTTYHAPRLIVAYTDAAEPSLIQGVSIR